MCVCCVQRDILIECKLKYAFFHLLRHIFSKMTRDNFDFSGFFTIVFTEHNESCEEIIRKIFKDCWSLYIANANILIPTEDYETVLMYTYIPFKPNRCEHVDPVIQDYFENDTFALNTPIFPNKFTNFFKCPLFASLYNFAPFVMLHPQPDGLHYIDGIEGSLLQFMSQRLNFTTIVVPSTTNVLKNITNSSNTEIPNSTLRRSLDVVKMKSGP